MKAPTWTQRHPALLSAVVGTVLLASLALSPARAAEVAPLGFAIGSATKKQVESGMKGRASLRPEGTNQYSRGPMLSAPGRGLGIDNLSQVTFIFDDKDVLAAVLMSFRKDPLGESFNRLYEHLAAKYPVVSKNVPFVGDKYVRFKKGDVLIDLEAPHLSFTMTATYMTTAFERAYRTETERRRQRQKAQERSQL